MSSPSLRLALLAAFAAAIGIVAGTILLRPAGIALRTGTLLQQPREIVDFRLVTSTGQTFTKADLAGHWTLIFPGFTFCPDVCPTTLATLKAVQARLGADAAKLRIVMLSVDPERDTPEKLGAYVHAFSADFLGVTGPTPELDRLGESIGYVYSKVPGATPATYTIDHSASMILIGPDARLRGYFSPPFQAEALADDLRRLTEAPATAS